MAKNTLVALRMPDDMKRRLQSIAKTQRRTMSNLILVALEKYLDEADPTRPPSPDAG